MSETIQVREDEQFDRERVEEYIRERIDGLPEGELEVLQFPSGASNLTYLLRIGDWEGVLRRPPLGPVPPKAHDMGRESKVLSRIHDHFSLAPKPYFFTDDESVIGAPFYVMERRKGLVIDDTFPEGIEPTPELCRGLSETVVETLVRLHAVDLEEAGLGDLGRPEGFLERQVQGWIGRFEKAMTEDVQGIEDLEPLTEWLSGNIPESPPATIVHNDFKLNNFILDPDDPTSVVALLDWEMTTIGDPLVDLGASLSYWIEPDDPEDLKQVLPTVVGSEPGFLTRSEFVDLYAERSGLDVSNVRYYLVFGYFRLAVIVQQIYARWYNGQTKDERFASFGGRVRGLIEHAAALTRSSGPL